ncbi:pirin family protein [Ferrimonas aestuarii]|uniref:Pirin family protein n=1 Tax=Ferrimonas aestuarii TaxID=2569539 RepID=A0A4U1BMY1_9GAMM|nr:pirin family protein [Ferrimonas aestuarii]TKB54707.1 pirin family protein [Ferrimonas aestuarii]
MKSISLLKQAQVEQIWPARAVSDGAGVRINRSAHSNDMARMDPFLMLDELGSDNADDYIGGFPEHPHRGFETVTYMLKGRMQHKDHMGNVGELASGDVQWMTAGRGVLHSEMPMQESGRLHGFQLWVNLPAAQKMVSAKYRHIDAKRIPIAEASGTAVKVIAGQFQAWQQGWQPAVEGAVTGIATSPWMFDITLDAQAELQLALNPQHKVLLYVYQGQVQVGEQGHSQVVRQQQMVKLTAAEALALTAVDNVKLLLLAGKPIGEPVVQYGPFVMNSMAEINQAMLDYQQGRLVSNNTESAC